jgi:hypothetical protein
MRMTKSRLQLEDYIKKDIGMDIFLDMDINGDYEEVTMLELFLSYKEKFS